MFNKHKFSTCYIFDLFLFSCSKGDKREYVGMCFRTQASGQTNFLWLFLLSLFCRSLKRVYVS